ncbi:hypothetical protein ACHQM5_013765 [Ranunculus cassubicifolius]
MFPPPGTSISSLHSDIIRTHILPSLDGLSLASLSSTSSQFYSLSKEETLWTNICTTTWPSCSHPRIRQLISHFPNGPRTFFSDSFPLLLTHPDTHPQNPCSPYPIELVSAVDIHYKTKLIFSKVHVTETMSRWFKCAWLRIDLVDPKMVFPTPIQIKGKNCQTLMEDLTLTWNIILGTRAANLSSFHPVSVNQHWLTKDIQVNFATILSVAQEEDVKCEITVTFEENMDVCEVSMQIYDMDGICLNGQKSLGILQNAIERGERKNLTREKCRERYANYVKRTMERLGSVGIRLVGTSKYKPSC